MKDYIALARIHQYLKNLFIFLPLFFAGKFFDIALLSEAFLAFLAFSATASGVYVLNDYMDIKEDAAHPTKKFRPLASGRIGKKSAIIYMAVLFIFGFALMASLSLEAFGVLVAYVALNVAYSFKLKHVPIVDITVIALGFVFRLFVGSFVDSIDLSMWIVVMTFLLALFLALAKRRDDVLIFLDTGKRMRKVIDGYNLKFLDSAMMIMASVVIVAYMLYTVSPEVVERFSSDKLYLTAFFVLLGILRYMQKAFVEEDSGSPTKVLMKDRFLQFVIAGWIISFIAIIY